MESLTKAIPDICIEVVKIIRVQFSWSDKLRTASDEKLERFKFAILLMIANMCWVKKKPKGHKKLIWNSPFIPHFFHSSLQKLNSPWGEPFTRLKSTGLYNAFHGVVNMQSAGLKPSMSMWWPYLHSNNKNFPQIKKSTTASATRILLVRLNLFWIKGCTN